MTAWAPRWHGRTAGHQKENEFRRQGKNNKTGKKNSRLGVGAVAGLFLGEAAPCTVPPCSDTLHDAGSRIRSGSHACACGMACTRSWMGQQVPRASVRRTASKCKKCTDPPAKMRVQGYPSTPCVRMLGWLHTVLRTCKIAWPWPQNCAMAPLTLARQPSDVPAGWLGENNFSLLNNVSEGKGGGGLKEGWKENAGQAGPTRTMHEGPSISQREGTHAG